MWNRHLQKLLPLGLAALLAACGSTVKLDEPKVEDAKPVEVKSGANTAPNPNPGGGQMVKQVDVSTSAATGQTPKDIALVIYFDFDSYLIRPEFQSVIENHAKFIKANKAAKLSLEGHTDERGGREYNLSLGQKRAEAVRRALGVLGVAEDQVEAVSFGKEKPADPGTSEESMAKNRRAVFSYR